MTSNDVDPPLPPIHPEPGLRLMRIRVLRQTDRCSMENLLLCCAAREKVRHLVYLYHPQYTKQPVVEGVTILNLMVLAIANALRNDIAL